MTWKIIVSNRARAHLRNISRYTIRTWGKDQEQKYMGLIKSAFRELLENPKSGRARPEIAQGVRSLVAGRHVIIHQIGEGRIEILGVVHAQMDLKQQLRK